MGCEWRGLALLRWSHREGNRLTVLRRGWRSGGAGLVCSEAGFFGFVCGSPFVSDCDNPSIKARIGVRTCPLNLLG